MKKLLLGLLLTFGLSTVSYCTAAEVTSSLVFKDVWGSHKLACYSCTLAADDDYFTFGNSAVISYWLTSRTDNLADGPVVDDVSAGVFTFGATGACSVYLWIIYD